LSRTRFLNFTGIQEAAAFLGIRLTFLSHHARVVGKGNEKMGIDMRDSRLLSILILILITLTGCSAMQIYSGSQDIQTLLENQAYQLRVRTGNEMIDKAVYEFAFNEFSKYLPIAEKELYTGTLDVLFFSTPKTALFESSGWYTEDGYVGARDSSFTGDRSVVSGETITWQDSTTVVTIKNKDGKKLWSADYTYKGRWELSGFVANTPQEVARLCIKRIARRMKKGFAPAK
jgi:hypothetical protein